MVKLSQLEVPDRIKAAIEPIKDNDEAVQNYGVYTALEMVKRILDANAAPGIHFFTLNRYNNFDNKSAKNYIKKRLRYICLYNLKITGNSGDIYV
jgi:hypothetical protein